MAKFVLFLAIMLFLCNACKQEVAVPAVDTVTNTNVLDENSINQIIKDVILAEAEFDEVFAIGLDLTLQTNSIITDPALTSQTFNYTYGSCNVDALIQKSGSMITISLDFGQNACIGNFSKGKSGKLIYTFANSYFVEDGVVETFFENYRSADTNISGLLRVTNLGYSAANDTLSHSIEIEDAVLGFERDSIRNFNSTRVSEWTESGGLTSSTINDDTFDIISGNYNGRSRLGDSFSASVFDDNTLGTPLLKVKHECWLAGIFKPSQGVININSEEAFATYGIEGSPCLNTIAVTLNYILNP